MTKLTTGPGRPKLKDKKVQFTFYIRKSMLDVFGTERLRDLLSEILPLIAKKIKQEKDNE